MAKDTGRNSGPEPGAKQLSFPIEGGPMDGSVVEGNEAILDLFWANHRYRFNLVKGVYEYVGIVWLDGRAAILEATPGPTAVASRDVQLGSGSGAG